MTFDDTYTYVYIIIYIDTYEYDTYGIICNLIYIEIEALIVLFTYYI